MMADQLPDSKQDQRNIDVNNQTDQPADDQKQGQVIARAVSSFGDLSYAIDVNPIVMSRAPDPLETFSGNQLKAQDAYYEEQEKKHRQNLHVLAMHANIDAGRQKRQQAVRQHDGKARSGTLIEAIMNGKDANQFVKDVNFASDQKRQQHERVKQQTRTDIEQQVTGVDANTRQQALDDQTVSALDQILDNGQLNGVAVATAKNSDSSSSSSESKTSQEELKDTGQTDKTVLGQDDNSLGLTDALTGKDNMDDPADLLSMIQADFEVVNAEQTVSQDSQPMINLNIRLGAIPSTIRDRNGFVVDLSKKDLAKLKEQLKKRLGKVMKRPVPIKTFNHLVAGNHQPSYNETELSNTILKGHYVDFSKTISEAHPLKFCAPILEDRLDKGEAIPDIAKARTPVDQALAKNHRNQVERFNQADLKAYAEDLKLKRENHGKEDKKLNQPSKHVDKSGPELEM